MSSESSKECNESVKVENNEMEQKETSIDSKKRKKDRKPFQWTEKRKEAFDKMRAGLELKNEIALKLKQEKQKSEKDEIKKRVRDIMNGHSKSEKEESANNSDESSDSEKETRKAGSNKKSKEKSKGEAKESKRKEKKSRKAEKYVSESESGEENESESDSEEEEKFVRSKKSADKAQKGRVQTGKTQRTSTHYHNSDRFILL